MRWGEGVDEVDEFEGIAIEEELELVLFIGGGEGDMAMLFAQRVLLDFGMLVLRLGLE